MYVWSGPIFLDYYRFELFQNLMYIIMNNTVFLSFVSCCFYKVSDKNEDLDIFHNFEAKIYKETYTGINIIYLINLSDSGNLKLTQKCIKSRDTISK